MDKLRLHRRGIALLQVMSVVAVVTVLGVTMLSGTSLQTRSAGNRADAMQADALSESGLNLASYYLQYPQAAPTLNADGYWPGAEGITIPGLEGTIDVRVTRSGGNYAVSTTGHAGASLTRRMSAMVRCSQGAPVRHALSVSTPNVLNLGLNMTIQGDVQAKGPVSTVAGLLVGGTIFSPDISLVLPGTSIGVQVTPARNIVIPTAYNLSDYRQYAYGGQFYKATELATNSLGNVTLGPTASNPAGVYYYSYNSTSKSGTLSLNGNVTINGTLIADNAVLAVRGANNTITAAPGFPALIASRDVRFFGIGNGLQVFGLAWVGGSVRQDSILVLLPAFRVDGALIFGGAGSVDPLFVGSVIVNYVAGRVAVPDLDQRYPSGARLLAWGRS